MPRPSEDWPGFTDLKPESEKYKRIQLILSSANFEHLKKRAIDSRRRHQTNLPPDIGCNINLTNFTSGFNNLVLELAFSDNVYWIARIPHQILNEDSRTALLSEIATMNIIRKRTSIPVPQIFEFEMSLEDQKFGYPYVLMEYLGGRVLPLGVAKSIPLQHHPKVAKQLANVFVELQNITFDRIGRLWCGDNADQPVEIIASGWHQTPGPLETSLEYFYNQIQGDNRETIALHPDDPEWLTACWMLKVALAHIIIEGRVRGPFPLCHLDLHSGNLLFDEEHNLTGVIDWSHAQTAPLEQLSVCPEFVTFPGRSEEYNQPIVQLRNLVIQSMRQMEKEKEKEKKSPLDDQQVNTKQKLDLTPLSTYMASTRAIIAHRLYMASPRSSLFAGRTVAKLMYGDSITWEQLKEVYGTMALS